MLGGVITVQILSLTRCNLRKNHATAIREGWSAETSGGGRWGREKGGRILKQIKPV